MQVVLLAAGMGLRLGPLTRTTPKAMIHLNEKPLVDYTLAPLLANKKVTEVIVVGGFEFSSLKSHIEKNYSPFGDRVRVVRNSQFTKGNLYTLCAALPYLEGSFLICNVDHIYQEDTWRFILQEREEAAIFCDFFRDFQADEMKVLLDENKNLVEMAKDLEDFDCCYVGLTYVPASRSADYQRAIHKTIKAFGDKALVENVLPLLAGLKNKIQVIPFDRHQWYEIDTRKDLAQAQDSLLDLSATQTLIQVD